MSFGAGVPGSAAMSPATLPLMNSAGPYPTSLPGALHAVQRFPEGFSVRSFAWARMVIRRTERGADAA